ncbi:hypothetical protein AKG95_28685 (plasmid) [Janthinobacterium lividum]|uniref:Uncharacterized protein n=1 Tax=Janthinobacterium lividum TaxID=29581 RepID=A0A1S1TZP7_9BURK|nr:hypothetical protein AKG95_28685 [Janthinobacterium lividum]
MGLALAYLLLHRFQRRLPAVDIDADQLQKVDFEYTGSMITTNARRAQGCQPSRQVRLFEIPVKVLRIDVREC